MMECWLSCYDGRRLSLPQAFRWTFRYGLGAPCDSFFVQCLWGETAAPELGDATRFYAQKGAQRVFSGVVDEYETRWDSRGARLDIHGRGMAALLLDNEAVGADYQLATVEDIVQNHVKPYGVETVQGEKLPSVPGYSVKTGSSEWAVVYEFARYHGGVLPRFDREGRLRLDGGASGRRVLDETAPITWAALGERRYGVLSQVLVRDRTGRGEQKVINQNFTRQGGMSRKVLTLPRKSGYEAKRYSGQYQLDRSAEGTKTLTLRLASPWAAWPGERVELRVERPRLSGTWLVDQCETGVDGEGAYTQLTMVNNKWK